MLLFHRTMQVPQMLVEYCSRNKMLAYATGTKGGGGSSTKSRSKTKTQNKCIYKSDESASSSSSKYVQEEISPSSCELWYVGESTTGNVS